MQKFFYKNLFWLILINLIVKPFAIFFIDAQIQNKVGSYNYGLYFTFLNISYVFSVLLDLGLSNYNVKKVTKNSRSLNIYFASSLSFRFILLILSAFLLLIFSFLLSYTNEQRFYLFWIFFNLFLISTIGFLRSFFTGLLLFKMEILLSVLDKVFWIIILGYWIYFLPNVSIKINDFIAVQSLSYFLVFILAFFVLVKKIGLPKFYFKWKWYLNILKKSYPYALLILLMMIYNRVDVVLIEKIAGAKEAGIYAQSYRLLDACFMFAGLFTSLLFPLFSKMLHDKVNIIPLLNSSQFVLLVFSVIVASICFYYNHEIISTLYLQDKENSTKILPILMLCLIPLSFTLVQGTLLTAATELRFLNSISILGIIINIFLNLILINKFGALGAAISAFATQSLLAILQIIKVDFVFNKGKSKAEYFNYILVISTCFILFYLMNLYYHSFFGILICLIIFLVVTIFLKRKKLIVLLTSIF